MLYGFEGNPRSGKSHDMVRLHVLENLRKGRTVYARINGLNHEAIASYLGVELGYVERHLIVLSESQVAEFLVCVTSDDGSVAFPHLERGALVLVDECQEYWPVGRAELPDRVLDFFAKHGHWGLDVVVASQDLREVHRSVIRRMQKKSIVTKLDVLGADSSYSVRYMAATRPGSFEQVGVEKLKYDPAIWKLYHGVQPGVESNEPYKVGSRTLWQSLRLPVIAVLVVFLIGVFFIVRFFATPDTFVPDTEKAASVAASPGAAPSSRPSPPSKAAVVVDPSLPAPPPKVQYPATIQYLLDLQGRARPRYAGAIGDRHLIEFRETGGDSRAIERLDTTQLRDMGWVVTAASYGLILQFRDAVIVFTPWPIDPVFQQSQQLTQQLSTMPLVNGPAADGPPLVASDSGSLSASSSAVYGTLHGYGDIGVK